MDTTQLQYVFSNDPRTRKYFLGVFPSNYLPMQIPKFPSCFVANVDSSEKPGSHWVAFYLPGPGEMEFFDSYGNSPDFYQGPIEEYTYRHHVTYNPHVIQSHNTAVCGQHCVYYLYSRCRGRTLKECVSPFENNRICNDRRVYNFVAKRFLVYTNFYQ